ncbi:MAG: TRAP transporter large permease [Deltaproteobacteria bacterium]|jgi:tripartite ATP-independent transporter DctM subunit|nr:TRAP transporter large permease [Deltaproteobacteria bacterium]
MLLIIACLTLLALLILGLPIYVAVLSTICVYFIGAEGLSPMIAVQRLVASNENNALLAVPFFILLGAILNRAGVTDRVMDLAALMTRRLRGGTAQTNILLSTLLGGISASSLADCAMMTKIMVPTMVDRKYPRSFSTVVTAIGSLITPIIPPGLGLILYGFTAEISIRRMFMAGILPGVFMCLTFMATVAFLSRRHGYEPPRKDPTPPGTWPRTLKRSLPSLTLIVLIIGGVRSGIFTPTEAGAIAVAYALIVGFVIHRDLKICHLGPAMKETLVSTASIMLVIMSCSVLAWIFSWEGLSQKIMVFLTGLTQSRYVFLLAINLFLMFLGCFMEGNSIIIVLTPLLKPTILALGIDPVHFGIILIVNVAIGALTPPVGTIMLLSSNISGIKVSEFFKAGKLFFIVILIDLLIVTYCPIMSLALAK